MKDFNKVVKKMGKNGGKVLLKKDIFELVDPEYKSEYQSFVNKLIYRLRSQGHIISIKSGVYIVPSKEDRALNAVDLIEKYYMKLIKKYIQQYVGSHYYISGLKSLQFHMKDFSVPQKIYIVNRTLQKKIKIGQYEIIFKTLSGKIHGKKINLYSKFQKFTKNIEIQDIHMKCSCLELAIVESALISESYEGCDITPIIKALKKYKTVLNHEIFREVGRYKYNMSFNRLKEISKPLDTTLYQTFLDIIKQNGGCFVGEGLRAI